MRTISVGHLVLDGDAVENPAWRFFLNGQPAAPADGALPDWNYFASLGVSCNIAVDLPSVYATLQLGPDALLSWVLVARSSGSPLISASSPVPVVHGIQQIQVQVPASDLGGTLALELQMSLQVPPATTMGRFAPSKIGHRVFSTTTRIVLEGDADQLPLLPVSFGDQGIRNPSSALWWLRLLSRDLHDSASSSLWLWINTDNPQLRPLIEQSESEVADVWMRWLKVDFVRQLLREALSASALDVSKEYPEGSLGALFLGVVRLLGSSLDEVKSRYDDDPGRVEAELQALVNRDLDR